MTVLDQLDTEALSSPTENPPPPYDGLTQITTINAGHSSSRQWKPRFISQISRTIRNAFLLSSRKRSNTVNPLEPLSSPNPAPIPESLPTPESQEETRKIVLELIRGIVWANGGTTIMEVLDNCAALCARQQVSLPSILQELSFEGHTPVYWAIIQHQQPSNPSSDEVLMKLFALCSPLTRYTIHDFRRACLNMYSNSILQQIRSSPSTYPHSGTDIMLLQKDNTTSPIRGFRDSVQVSERGAHQSNEDTFSVKLELEMFQKRMRVSHEVQIEFIARREYHFRSLACLHAFLRDTMYA